MYKNGKQYEEYKQDNIYTIYKIALYYTSAWFQVSIGSQPKLQIILVNSMLCYLWLNGLDFTFTVRIW